MDVKKWSVKEAIRHLTELRSPFEQQATPTGLPNLAEKIKELTARNKSINLLEGVKPQ